MSRLFFCPFFPSPPSPGEFTFRKQAVDESNDQDQNVSHPTGTWMDPEPVTIVREHRSSTSKNRIEWEKLEDGVASKDVSLSTPTKKLSPPATPRSPQKNLCTTRPGRSPAGHSRTFVPPEARLSHFSSSLLLGCRFAAFAWMGVTAMQAAYTVGIPSTVGAYKSG